MTGSGTQADPYKIYNVTDLQNIENDLTAYYELANDIDASATVGWYARAGFVPIGNAAYFTGHFDGKGFTIDQLFINRPATSNVGLFGITRAIGIKNVKLTSCDITGKNYVGALVGELYGYAGSIVTIEGCSSSGSVSGESFIGGLFGEVCKWTYKIQVQDCHSSCTVISTKSYAGGLIGRLSGSDVSECYATGAVTVVAGDVFCYAGGFVGSVASGVISKCYAEGNASATSSNTGTRRTEAGGFVGSLGGSSSQLSDCYARGNATASATNGLEYAGGFLGRTWYSAASENEFCDNCFSTGIPTGANAGGFCGEKTEFAVTNCFWDTETSGQVTSSGGTGKTTAQMKARATFTDADWDFTTVWGIFGYCNGGYPCLLDVTPSCEARRKGNPNIDQLIYQHVERMDR